MIHPFRSFRRWLFLRIRIWNKNVFVTPRVSNYVNKFTLKGESSVMKDFLEKSKKLFRADMQTTVSQARFLELMVRATRSKNVLEIGTFRGYGTAHLAQALPPDGKVVTCEYSPEYAKEAQKLVTDLGIDTKVTIEVGKATDTLSRLIAENQKFDLIFIDADKPSYKTYFDLSLNLISPGGTILIDNTLWASLVTYKNPHDSIAEIAKSFNEYVFEKMGNNAVIIPVWDGMTMVVVP